jgi:GTP-binding protein Era
VGHGGETIKAIGIASRTELEEIYEGQVNVHLQVKVKKNWKDNPAALRALGFQ